MGTTENEAAIVAAASGKWIEPSSEFARHLLVGSAPPGHQHHVKASQPKDGDEEQGNHYHHNDTGTRKNTNIPFRSAGISTHLLNHVGK